MSVNVVINGKKIQAPEGALVIDVCREIGIDIPISATTRASAPTATAACARWIS
jgi:hypothetical protein